MNKYQALSGILAKVRGRKMRRQARHGTSVKELATRFDTQSTQIKTALHG